MWPWERSSSESHTAHLTNARGSSGPAPLSDTSLSPGHQPAPLAAPGGVAATEMPTGVPMSIVDGWPREPWGEMPRSESRDWERMRLRRSGISFSLGGRRSAVELMHGQQKLCAQPRTTKRFCRRTQRLQHTFCAGASSSRIGPPPSVRAAAIAAWGGELGKGDG